MARGDQKSYRGRGGGSAGGSAGYNDDGRGASKDAWEWFSENFESSGFSRDWLFSLYDERCRFLVYNSTYRYNLYDIMVINSPGADTRAKRLVDKHHNPAVWIEFHKYLLDGYNRYKAHREKIAAARDNEYEKIAAARDAEVARIEREDQESLTVEIENTAGTIRSEFEEAIVRHDKIGNDGDWIEEVVETYFTGSGFGYEENRSTGIKLQVTVSLDLSNSMYYNGINVVAAEAFRNISMALLKMRDEFENNLFVKFFEFSLDEYNEPGKYTRTIDDDIRYDRGYRGFDSYSPERLRDSYGRGDFSGEDTWIYPLFERIEKWENEHSDPGAVKLDLIITDAVLEHVTDIRKSDIIQERRDGSLQSVFLNFMKESEWLGSTLPKRCFQMGVDKDNVSGILRKVLAEFLSVQM